MGSVERALFLAVVATVLVGLWFMLGVLAWRVLGGVCG